jgi:hypothetical protein
MYTFAMQCYGHYPYIAQRIQQVNVTGFDKANQFAWKIKDGDSAELRNRPGHAGCWIIAFNTTLPVRCVDTQNNPIPAEQIKTGYYADVAFNVQPNGKTDHTCGLYVNPGIVRLLGYDTEITPGPTADQAFGGIGRAMGQAAPVGAGVPGGVMPPLPAGSFTGYGQAQPAYQPAPQSPPPAPRGYGGAMTAPATFPPAGGAVGYAQAGHVPTGAAHANQPAGYPGTPGIAAPGLGVQHGHAQASTGGMGGAPSVPSMPSLPHAPFATTGPAMPVGVVPPSPGFTVAAQGVPAGAVPVGADYTAQQQGLPTASPSNVPSVPGFSHGAA